MHAASCSCAVSLAAPSASAAVTATHHTAAAPTSHNVLDFMSSPSNGELIGAGMRLRARLCREPKYRERLLRLSCGRNLRVGLAAQPPSIATPRPPVAVDGIFRAQGEESDI